MGSGKSRLSSKKIASLQNVTYFSDQEIQDWYKAFIKEVPDGQMDLKQFLNVWKDLFMNKTEKKMVFDAVELENYGKQIFKLIDKNGDGSIDFREFLINVSVETRGTLDEKLEHVFNLYDLDKNGYVTKPEMVEFIKVVHKAIDAGNHSKGEPISPEALAEGLANRIFCKLDQNKDGKLSLFEFTAGIKSEPCLVQYFVGQTATS